MVVEGGFGWGKKWSVGRLIPGKGFGESGRASRGFGGSWKGKGIGPGAIFGFKRGDKGGKRGGKL